MFHILHISDLHFGPTYIPRVGAALLEKIPKLPIDMVVASGDFTQRAKQEQYREANAFLESLPEVPLIVVPGNHDVPLYRVWERLTRPYALYLRYISPELDTIFRSDQVVVAALNTTRPLRAITRGRIDRWQLDFCAQAFSGVGPEPVRIVVAHHHFAPAPDYENEHDAIPGARKALERFTQLEVELILGGHLHRAYIGNSLDIHPGIDRSHGIILVQAGTATSQRGRAREREKNSFNLIGISDDETHITHYMYFEEAGGFEPQAKHVYPRRRKKWLSAADAARPA